MNKEKIKNIEALFETTKNNSYVKLKWFDYQKIMNYITNLQEENRQLRADYGSKSQVERDLLEYRIDKALDYIENYLHEHVIEDHPDEQSTFYDEQDNFIPNAKEELLNILKGEDK